MYKIEYIGSWKSIPEAAAAIYDSDIPKLEAMLQNGLNLNAPIQFSEHIKLMPLEIAVFQNNVPMIHFLLEHGARRRSYSAYSRSLLQAGCGDALCETSCKAQFR